MNMETGETMPENPLDIMYRQQFVMMKLPKFLESGQPPLGKCQILFEFHLDT